MQISPDQWIMFHAGPLPVSATIVFTWVVMAILIGSALLVRMRLSDDGGLTRFQSLWEAVVETTRTQIRELSGQDPGPYLGFIGTLFLFIATANVLAVVPGFTAPTGSLATTTALALCVLVAVPVYGMIDRGVLGYLKGYLQPTPLMAPFNVIGEISRTLALAIRLYGNAMSGTVIVGILISVAPFLFPVAMQMLGLLTGVIQAYIFAILAMVYIASASRAHDRADAGANDRRHPDNA